MPAPVVYWEIAGPDGKALRDFYATVFGWTLDTTRMPGYAYVDTGTPSPPHGGIREEPTVPADKVLYIQVPDLGAALEGIRTAGGRQLLPPTDVPGGGKFALFMDPAGNVMGLFRT